MKLSEELRKLQDKIHVYIEPIISSTEALESEAEFVGEALKARTQELVNLKRSNELHKSIATSEGDQADEDYAALQKELAALEEPMECGQVSVGEAEQFIRKLGACSSIGAKLVLLRQFYERQHSADLREVAEMAVRRAMNRINHPSQVAKIADIVLSEFCEKKAKVNHD